MVPGVVRRVSNQNHIEQTTRPFALKDLIETT